MSLLTFLAKFPACPALEIIEAILFVLCMILAIHRSLFINVWIPDITGKVDSKDDCVFWISEERRQICSAAFVSGTFSFFLRHLCCTKVPEARGEAFDTIDLKGFSQFFYF